MPQSTPHHVTVAVAVGPRSSILDLLAQALGMLLDSPRTLGRALARDPDGRLHEAVVVWLDLPARCLPEALAEYVRAHGMPSRKATKSLLGVLQSVDHVYALFEDMSALRRWAMTPQSENSVNVVSFPLVRSGDPLYRRELEARIRRTQNGIW